MRLTEVASWVMLVLPLDRMCLWRSNGGDLEKEPEGATRYSQQYQPIAAEGFARIILSLKVETFLSDLWTYLSLSPFPRLTLPRLIHPSNQIMSLEAAGGIPFFLY